MAGLILMPWIVFIIAVVLQHDVTDATPTCTGALDVVFVVDGTKHSAGQDDIQHDMDSLKAFLQNVSHQLFTRTRDLRIAQVEYGSEGQRTFPFTNNDTQVSSFIRETRCHDGPPDITEALLVATELIQEQSYLQRDTHILLVTANTSHHEQEGVNSEWDSNKLPIIAVGYTDAAAEAVLLQTTGKRSNVLLVPSRDALSFIVNTTVDKLLCPDKGSLKIPGSVTNAALKYKGPLDVVFVVNVALNTRREAATEMTNLRNYLVAVSNYLFDKTSDLRIAQIVFGKNAAPSGGGRFSFRGSKHQVRALINEMQYMERPGNVIAGIRQAWHTLKRTGNGRPASILLVTGRTTHRHNRGRNQPLKHMKLPPIVAVGYSNSVRRNVLYSITKVDSNVLVVGNHDDLLSVANTTAQKLLLCHDRDTKTSTEPPDDMVHHNNRTLVPNKETFQKLSQDATLDPTRFNAEVTALIKVYDGPVEDYLEFDVFVEVLPKYRMANLSIADVDRKSPDLFNSLPDSKKLALTRQTLEPLSLLEMQLEIEDNFRSKGCGFVGSVNVSVLIRPGHVSLGLALDMCDCSQQETPHIPAKMDILCKIILTNTKTLQEFMDIQERLCPLCFAYILRIRPTWQKEVVADEDMRNSACDKIGHSFILPPSVLAHWARVCGERLNHASCNASRPSLMLHGPHAPSVAELAVCKDVFCHRLCHLTEADIEVIRQTLNQHNAEDVGCLAYLDGVKSPVNMVMYPHRAHSLKASSIDGSCRLKSRVIKRAKEAGRRKKRTCSVTCEDITGDIRDGIVPPDVLDAPQLETCFEEDLYTCVQENHLGDYHWDMAQAKAIFTRIRQDLTLEHFQNSTTCDLEVLGYIGLGFTPNELAAIDRISPEVYNIFGATYGWSKEQLQTLASRYLQDIYPRALEDVDLARLNHLVCGLRAEQVKEIPIKAIKNTTPILGRMRRCEIEVLEVLAQRLILYHGPVATWPEDHFSEFGIMLAGLSGDDLKAAGATLVDHVTVPVVNHIPPTEFWKLTPEQTSLFSYDVSLAVSQRGLCAWLTDQHKKGYLEYLCSAGTKRSWGITVLVLVVVASSLGEWS